LFSIYILLIIIIIIIIKHRLGTAKHRLGRSPCLLQNMFLTLVLPNLNRSG